MSSEIRWRTILLTFSLLTHSVCFGDQMANADLIVVKIGGSLFDWPSLRPALRKWIATFKSESLLLIAGGGHSADAVRMYDQIHQLGEEASHWLALHSMAVTAEILKRFVFDLPRVTVLDALAFCENEHDLPHSWNVTSDSIAAKVAEVRHAKRLILLKSVDMPPEKTWNELAEMDIVDHYFPTIASHFTGQIELVNLRSLKSE